MASFKPATNITISGIAMGLTSMILQTLQANMIVIPDEVMNNLPGFVAVIAAYFWDVATGGNLPVALPEKGASVGDTVPPMSKPNP